MLVSYSIAKEAEDSGEAFQPGEGGAANGTGGGGGSSSAGGSSDDEKPAKGMKGKGTANGQGERLYWRRRPGANEVRGMKP